MAAVEMYDYLNEVTPDYAGTLSVTPTEVLVEQGNFQQLTYEMDSGDAEVVSLSQNRTFLVTLQWDAQNPDDAGTIVDFYFDTAKGFGRARTFYWQHPLDGHTYVVRFWSDLAREMRGGYGTRQWIKSVTLKVEGKKLDA